MPKVQVDTIDNEPVYYDNGKFIAAVDGVDYTAPTLAALKAKLKGADQPVEVFKFYLSISGGYQSKVEPFTVVSPNKKMVFEIKEDRYSSTPGKKIKERISSDDLFIYTPEVAEQFNAMLVKAQLLRKEWEQLKNSAKRFP